MFSALRENGKHALTDTRIFPIFTEDPAFSRPLRVYLH
jgi:hypothetical protein